MDKYSIKKLPNGLEYILIDNQSVETISLCVSIRVGSNDEAENVNGISHLIEHMIYKSNRLFKTKYDLYKALDTIGASYNAYTDKNITTFFVKSDAIHQKNLIDVFSSLICEPIINEIDLENEKSVVIEEIQNNNEDPIDCIYNRFFKLIYPNYPISQKISGPPENIRNITVQDIKNHLNKFYTSNNMVVSISGKLDKDIDKILEQSNFSKAKSALETTINKELVPHSKTTSINFVQKPIKQIFLGISFPTSGLYNNDKYAIKLLELILNGSMSSRLFVRLREEEGLVYSISASSADYEEGGIFFIITSCDKEKYQQSVTSLLQEFKKLQTTLISEEELQRWKNFIRSSMIMDIENTMDVADYYAREMLFYRKNIISFTNLIHKFMEPNVNDIMRVAKKLFDWRHMKLIVMGEYSLNGKKIVENIMRIVKETYSN